MQIIPNLALAGAEVMLENLVMALIKDGYELGVVSLFNEQSAITKRLHSQDVPVRYMNKRRGLDLKMISSLYKLFINEKPDVIHTHRYAMQYVIPAAVLARVPIRVHTIHNVADKEVGKLQRKLHWYFFEFLKVIPVAISPLVKNTVIEEYGFSENKIPMIYNGIDLKKCLIKEQYQHENVLKIINVGRFTEQKNQIGLIESFKIVNEKAPNTVLQLIGEGELEKELRHKVKELELENVVEFLGLQPNIYQYLYQADIFVLPSSWEGMPITIIEAMATGLPIVATKVGGVPDMVEEGITGLLVEKNINQVAEALLKLVYDSKLREKIGNEAKKSAKRFSSEEMALKYSTLYKLVN